jgi:phosphatidylglycerophosphate synthase
VRSTRPSRQAGIRSARQLSPHSLRHTYATGLNHAGVALQAIQDALGHADPRTTRRYMASRQHLDCHATYAFAAWLRRTPDTLGMAEGGDGVPRRRLSPADAVTLARFWLVPLTVAARRTPRGLATIIASGGLTDAVDGHLARRYGRTRLGRDLDTTADLCFLTAAAMSLHAAGRLPSPAAWALGARHALGVALTTGAVLARARRPAIRARPAGGALRIVGLVLCAYDHRRTGAIILVAGCLTPPRSTMPNLSAA